MASEPISPKIPKSWPYLKLHGRVIEALMTLPAYFKTSTVIEGISATDIFTLNSALGATIEEQVVSTLNGMRPVWDPDKEYGLYSFVRQAQTFPDVLLRKTGNSRREDILFGIELKGWYLLAKEGVPGLRFCVSPSACAVQDLVCVVPWSLTNVLSGAPQTYVPYITSARYAAEYRNYFWQTLRGSKSDVGIDFASGVGPYPVKSDRISDKPKQNGGKNFGRLARTGMMDDYLAASLGVLLCGIPAQDWLRFFEIFKDQRPRDYVEGRINQLRARIAPKEGYDDPLEAILDQCERLLADR